MLSLMSTFVVRQATAGFCFIGSVVRRRGSPWKGVSHHLLRIYVMNKNDMYAAAGLFIALVHLVVVLVK